MKMNLTDICGAARTPHPAFSPLVVRGVRTAPRKAFASEHRRSLCGQELGRTLVEVMIASSLLAMVVLAILSVHLAGLRFAGFVLPKIQNAEYSRQLVSRMIEEIRCANTVAVGTGTVSSFTAAAANRPQVGNAIRVYPSTNSSSCIYYFQDTNTWTVQRMDLNSTQPLVIADQVTNLLVFSMENFSGTTLTNPQNNCVLSMLLQMRRPTTARGVSDTLQVRSKITRRNIF
jgi:hypothetical protein